MPQLVELSLNPEHAYDKAVILQSLAKKTGVSEASITGFNLLKRSIDARKKPVRYLLRIEVFIGEPYRTVSFFIDYGDVRSAPPVHIIGSGPCGLFAALRVIELGYRPIVFERGKDVRSRRRDLAAINRNVGVNPESNYCFGEGGAGTYSDGKLYTRSTKRGDVQRILQILHQFGAPEEILVNAHPHIGTNKLPQIITGMRQQIIACGGEVHFDSKLTNLILEEGALKAIVINDEKEVPVISLILATGHSARDIFQLLHARGIAIESKPFALGVRVEHPQEVIDQIQYKQQDRGPYLPPASYSIVEQVEGKGVFSFCMCPGGIIAPCATHPGEIVTNGWSPSKRNNPFANSGIVVTVDQQDFQQAGFTGPLAGMYFQQMVEQACWRAGGSGQIAPAQRMIDFVRGIRSECLPPCSYQPGLQSARLDQLLPARVASSLQHAFVAFGKKLRGYYTNDAVLVAPESRTSSPVRIPRDAESLQHPAVQGLFPAGEGAGYAGGIVSAAIDGEKCADAAVQALKIGNR